MAKGQIKDLKEYYKTAYGVGEDLNIISAKDLIIMPASVIENNYSSIWEVETATVTVTAPDGEVIVIAETPSQSKTINLSANGTYLVRYVGRTYHAVIVNGGGPGTGTTYADYAFQILFATTKNKLPLKKWTITDVINRLLDVAEPLRKGEAPRFRLNAEQAKRFDKILSPEMSFTKQTLRECLQQIGGVIHGEPRLTPVKDENGKWIYEISYDMFAGKEGSEIQYMAYTDRGQQHVIESYLGWLDSTAENLINQMDKFGGVVVEPYAKGAVSVRTENLYVRIEEGNMLIPTQYPIYTVEKLEFVYEDDGVLFSVDITPYVFEISEYNGRLSSYDGVWPYSKCYGLYFTQGSKNISGLNFKPPAETSALTPFKEYAITNILREATGNSTLSLDYPKMCFRVTYTPFYNARVGQTKINYKDFKYPAALIYNQQANLIEGRAYGENLKGAAARLGNTELSLTYNLRKLNEVAIAGLKFNSKYYISAVATEIYPTLIKSTIGLSRDFNRLSQYIGVSSVKRYYEVSKTQAEERNTLYREFVVIGDKETPDTDVLAGKGMLELIAALFSPPGVPIGPVTNVVAWGTSYQGDDNNAVNLPVISSAFGNSISFSWSYEDNYSAGAFAQYQSNVNVKGYFQQSYPYGDYYGRLYFYNFDLQYSGTASTTDNYEEIGLSLPKASKPAVSSGIVSTIGKTPYKIRKDNREALQINFQIDFVTNLDNLIIGSALASYCPAVRGTSSALTPRLYVFPTELNKFTDHVEAFEDVTLSKMQSVAVKVSVEDGYLVITSGFFPEDGMSWAIVTGQRELTETVEGEDGVQTQQTTYYGGDLLIGQNMEVKSGQSFAPIYFTLKREIFDKSVWKDIL